MSSSLSCVETLFTDAEAADMLSRALMSMGVSGVVPEKWQFGFFTTTQKRKIIHGIFLWIIELVERHNSQISSKDEPLGMNISSMKRIISNISIDWFQCLQIQNQRQTITFH